MLQIDESKIQAEVYAKSPTKDILYIKIAIPSLELYMNSFTVRPSPKFDGLWFQTPAFLMGKRWVKPLEFRNGSRLLDLMQDEAMRAADRYIQDNKLQNLFPGAVLIDQDEMGSVEF